MIDLASTERGGLIDPTSSTGVGGGIKGYIDLEVYSELLHFKLCLYFSLPNPSSTIENSQERKSFKTKYFMSF